MIMMVRICADVDSGEFPTRSHCNIHPILLYTGLVTGFILGTLGELDPSQQQEAQMLFGVRCVISSESLPHNY
jgi:hypothetical protein